MRYGSWLLVIACGCGPDERELPQCREEHQVEAALAATDDPLVSSGCLAALPCGLDYVGEFVDVAPNVAGPQFNCVAIEIDASLAERELPQCDQYGSAPTNTPCWRMGVLPGCVNDDLVMQIVRSVAADTTVRAECTGVCTYDLVRGPCAD